MQFWHSLTGPESPPDSDSEASDHGAAEAPDKTAGQLLQARKPSVEREDWMTKAMPKATPGAAQEGVADQLKEGVCQEGDIAFGS